MKEIYDKYRNGDPISDQELHTGILEFTKLEGQLRQLGERFLFSFLEVKRVNDGLKDYLKARREK